jgi:hypothetical protein
MNALFADTFYWIALADLADSAHQRAMIVTSERASWPIVTSDEVLVEYLTFFSAAPEPKRREVAGSVLEILANPAIRVIPQSRNRSSPVSICIRSGPISAIASRIAFRCKPCGTKASRKLLPTTAILSRRVLKRCSGIRVKVLCESGE